MKEQIIDKLKDQYQDIRSSIISLDMETKNDIRLQSRVDEMYYHLNRINKMIEEF